MTPSLRRSVYALLLIGAVAGCSAPPPQPPSNQGGDVTATDGSGAGQGTSLGSIGRQGSSAPATTPGASGTSGGTGTSGGSGATTASTPQESAARARVKAARDEAAKAQNQVAQQAAEECRDLASQIRAEQATERAAPSTSVNEDIVNATLAKADQRIDRLRRQYDSLGCSGSNVPAIHERVPQLPRAPGGLPP